jgi:hypothetical protein
MMPSNVYLIDKKQILLLNVLNLFGRVAHLDRALASEAKGGGFDPRLFHSIHLKVQLLLLNKKTRHKTGFFY